jgi:hypothetical protein
MKCKQVAMGGACGTSIAALLSAAALFAAHLVPSHAQTQPLTTPFLSQRDACAIERRIWSESLQHDREVRDRAWATAEAIAAPLLKQAADARAQGHNTASMDHANMMTLNAIFAMVMEEVGELGTKRQQLSPHFRAHFCG